MQTALGTQQLRDGGESVSKVQDSIGGAPSLVLVVLSGRAVLGAVDARGRAWPIPLQSNQIPLQSSASSQSTLHCWKGISQE